VAFHPLFEPFYFYRIADIPVLGTNGLAISIFQQLANIAAGYAVTYILGYILTALAGYLLGSIPTGFLVAEARGVDIRTVGSGNIGATNVFRYLGKPAGVFVLLVDALKGLLAVIVLSRLMAGWFYPDANLLEREWFEICAGISAAFARRSRAEIGAGCDRSGVESA